MANQRPNRCADHQLAQKRSPARDIDALVQLKFLAKAL